MSDPVNRKTLRYQGGVFYLEPEHSRPTISYSDHGAVIGSHTVEPEAMDELCKQWTEFRRRNARTA